MDYQFFTCKSGSGSAFFRIRQALGSIILALGASEPQGIDDLSSAISETEAITRAALDVMRERMEIINTYQNEWYRLSTVIDGLDSLGTKEQAIYDAVNLSPGLSVVEIATETGYSVDLVVHIVETLIYNNDLFREQDHIGFVRYGSRETASTELCDQRLLDAYNDVLANEGTTIEEAASRLYPSLDIGKAVAIVQKLYRCLLFARAVVRCP